ncbi:MAG TPA: hypothetical protein EYH31_13430 [Anaerolineae bacterium]|nr:hypothetical protein [Anaerolineae bacterium]
MTAYSAGYTDALSRTGDWSMRTGIVQGNPVESYSDFRQTVTLPANHSITLRYWRYSQTGETPAVAPPLSGAELMSRLRRGGDAALAGDWQYVLLLDSHNNIVKKLLWERSNAATWLEKTNDLSAYAGSTVKVQFGTYNDRYGGITSMHVDDVSLLACPTN